MMCASLEVIIPSAKADDPAYVGIGQHFDVIHAIAHSREQPIHVSENGKLVVAVSSAHAGRAADLAR